MPVCPWLDFFKEWCFIMINIVSGPNLCVDINFAGLISIKCTCSTVYISDGVRINAKDFLMALREYFSSVNEKPKSRQY